MHGTDPSTYHMGCKRSTIWAISSRFLHHKILNISSSTIVKIKNNAIHYVINKEKLNRNKIVITKLFWRYGVSIRSPYQSHAKQEIYHLSYIPTILISENLKCPVIKWKWKNISANYVINKERLNRSKILITNSFFIRCRISPYLSHSKWDLPSKLHPHNCCIIKPSNSHHKLHPHNCCIIKP